MTDVFGFFYIIITEGTGRIGFGITRSCFDRIDDYIAHTGMPKTSFIYLFWGQYDDIIKIEKDFKKLNLYYLVQTSLARIKKFLEIFKEL
jgi:hypothetical protein